jgi:hypothetical protein
MMMHKYRTKNSFKKIWFTVFFILTFISFPNLYGQNLRYRPGLELKLSESSVISMITIYPGNAIYSLFGHSAIRVFDPENSIDWLYNYGTFDFTDNMFVLKFIKGQLDYYLDVVSFKQALASYSKFENRKVIEQIFNFNLKQRQLIFDFLQNNAEPENKFYRYDFVRDNCSTRVADVLEKNFPNMVNYSAYKDSGKTFRQRIRYYLAGNSFADFGIQLVLGSKLDKIPVGNAIFFLPITVKDVFANAVFNNNFPLVKTEKILFEPVKNNSGNSGIAAKSSNYALWIFTALFICYAAMSVVLLKSRNPIAERIMETGESGAGNSVCALNPETAKGANSALIECAIGRLAKAVECYIFFATGFMGLLITYLWFFSSHFLTSSNFNFLWCTPLNFFLFIVVIRNNKQGKLSPFFNFAVVICFIMVVAYLFTAIFGAQAVPASFLPVIAILLMANGELVSRIILKKD